MPTRIDILTDEQRAQFDAHTDKWIDIGLRTGPADRELFERSVRDCYRYAGIDFPEVVVWVPSPLVLSFAAPAAACAIELIEAARRQPELGQRFLVDGAVDNAVRGAVDNAVGDAVRGAVRGAVDNAVHGAVRDAVHGAAVVHGAVRGAVGDAVDNAVGDAVDNAVDNAVHDAVDNAVRDAVDGAVRGAVRDAVGDAVGDTVDNAVGDAVRDAVGGAVGDAVRGAVRGAVDNAVRDAVGDAVGDTVDNAVGDAVRDAVRDAVGDAVRGAVRGAVDNAVRGAVRDAVEGAVDNAVDGAVDGAVGGAVGDAVRGAVRGAVEGAVDNAVDGAVDGAVGGAVGDAVRRAVQLSWNRRFAGQLWPGGWYWGGACTSFFREVCKLELSDGLWDRAKAFEGTIESACWWWPHRRFVMVSERPVELHRELVNVATPRGFNSHRLHSDTGPAVSWPDGWGVWASHGVRVTKQVIERPESLTVEQIRGEHNVEVRRVMMERFGHERYIHESGAQLVHEDEWGKLWRTAIPDDEDLVVVEVENSSPEPDGSYRSYMLRVHPELRPLHADGTNGKPQKLTARNAVASTFGCRGEDYTLEMQT
jgi:hypothetical protein